LDRGSSEIFTLAHAAFDMFNWRDITILLNRFYRLYLFFADQDTPITAGQQLDIMKPGAGSYATVTSVRFGSKAATQKP
jgi:hypothetical protein